ncbi:MAG: hypothetical protein WC579_01655 [Candidatus Paceibacterota bacterium]
MNINNFIDEYLATIKGMGGDKRFMELRAERLMGIDFYQGYQEYYVRKKYENIKNITIVTDNFTRRVVQEWSMVYKQSPKYSSEKLLGIFPNRINALKSCERYRNLLGMVLVRPLVDNGKGYHDVIMDFMPFFDYNEVSGEPVAYAYPYTNGNYNIWTNDEIVIFDFEGNIQERRRNDFGFMPFVPAFVEWGEWEHSGMNDVVRSNLVYNEGLTNLHHAHYFQSFKIPYVISESSLHNFNIDLDVSKPIVIENASGVNIGMLDNEANFTQSIEVLRYTLDRTLSNYHMRADFDESGNPSSGFSIIARKSGLLEAREGMIPGWQTFEKELYELEKKICSMNGISLEKEHIIEFKPVEMIKDQAEIRAHWDWLIANGYKRPIDYMIEEMGMTEEEAKKQIGEAGGEFVSALKTPVE